ncbi:DNA polymerase III subunit delta [Alicyclobacillus fastidiosus]|uniref:DNA polymerase III subunit delta n=1 Tax=Alicyclobacillus fastidiosus TaxID=392011 RepID=A0ABY6ZLK8_9BACL|nr:DNA polymerase III subunit delta [Alicyclobacillus fastidiosus]WAH43772.1 DNA polymerase III subunit delta [Alicyclobacillus fastidiosus]GMA59994.1 DNA polymerase III subunit delta [Alicyclobacillus fastidiosus]
MDYTTAYDQLNSGQVAPVYILYGEELFFMDQFTRKLTEMSDGQSCARFDFEEDGVEEALLELESVSLFLAQPVVVIRNCTAFLSQGKAGTQADLLESYLQNPVSQRTLVITVNGDKLDQRKKVTKAAKRHIVVDCQTPKPPVAIRILKQECKRMGMQMADDALEELWRRTGTVTRAGNELEKLSIYALGRSVTTQDVQLLVAETLEETVFDWVDHVTQGRIAEASFKLADMARQGYDPLALMAMLARQFRMMWFAKALSKRGMRIEDIAKEAKAHPFAMKVADRQARNFALSDLESLIRNAADFELDIKRGRRDAQQAIELLMLSCAGSTSTFRRAK